MPRQQTISEIVLLVHPFYNFAHPFYTFSERISEISSRWFMHSRNSRANASFLLGLWGNKIKKASENPNALVVIVAPNNVGNLGAFYGKMFANFIEFSRKTLGKRLFLVRTCVSSNHLKEKMKRHGFRFDENALHGRSFGEYWNGCVKRQTQNLQGILWELTGKSVPFEQVRSLSVKMSDYNARKSLSREKRKQNRGKNPR